MSEETAVTVIQRLAAYELERTAESRRTLIEEHSAAFRWLLASLLAINGGAIAFSKELLESQDRLPLFADACFLLGIITALLTAWFSQRANRKLLEPLAETAAFWLKGIEAGSLDEEEFSKIAERMNSAVKSARPTQICGWLSAAAFILGCVLIGIYLAS